MAAAGRKRVRRREEAAAAARRARANPEPRARAAARAHQLRVSMLYCDMRHSRAIWCMMTCRSFLVSGSDTPMLTASLKVAPPKHDGSLCGCCAHTPEPLPFPPPNAYSTPSISRPVWYRPPPATALMIASLMLPPARLYTSASRGCRLRARPHRGGEREQGCGGCQLGLDHARTRAKIY